MFQYYPSQSELFVPFPQKLDCYLKTFICRMSKFPRRRNSHYLQLQIVQLVQVYEFLSFLFGFSVKLNVYSSESPLIIYLASFFIQVH